MPEPWPPPAAPDDHVESKRVRQPGGPVLVPCREVRLWGRPVWLDDVSGRVWCPTCKRLVDVDELGQVDNGHTAVGLPFRAEGQLLSLGDDEEPAERDEWWPDDAA